MSISAKELAKMLNLSEAAVSLALNNKPGVSTQTRQKVWSLAQQMGYDFSKAHSRDARFKGTFCLASYQKTGTILTDSFYFTSLANGVLAGAKRNGYNLESLTILEDDDLDKHIYLVKKAEYAGVILLACEMDAASLQPFYNFKVPIVLLDTCLERHPFNCVTVDNRQGTALAVNHLLTKTRKHPGYLHSSYVTSTFAARSEGFFGAIKKLGLSTSSCVVHLLSPSQSGAYADMKELIKAGEELAQCYFADNDEIALGAMQAFEEAGYRIPEDISIVGFSDIPAAETCHPPLTTIHVPAQYMGELAAARMVQIIEEKLDRPTRIEVSTELKKRKSV